MVFPWAIKYTCVCAYVGTCAHAHTHTHIFFTLRKFDAADSEMKFLCYKSLQDMGYNDVKNIRVRENFFHTTEGLRLIETGQGFLGEMPSYISWPHSSLALPTPPWESGSNICINVPEYNLSGHERLGIWSLCLLSSGYSILELHKDTLWPWGKFFRSLQPQFIHL